MDGSAKKMKNSCTRNGVLRMTSMYALIRNRSHAGPPVLPQAQKMATTSPSSVAVSDSCTVIQVPLSSKGHAAKTASNWNW